MQSTLRIGGLIFVAALLYGSPASATTVKTNAPAPARPSARRKAYFGVASWYGPQHQGRKMANGQKFDRNKLTAASWYFPLGTFVRVTNISNGESVVVSITDRGPNHRLNRAVDLSEAAARQLDYIGAGLARVFLFPLMSLETEPSPTEASLHEPASNDSAPQYAEAKPVPLP